MGGTEFGILRELGRQVAEIAAEPAQAERRSLWRSLNGLRPVRPMVMIDQLPWHELDVDGELALRTSDPFLRELETRLRRTLYLSRHLPADRVVEPCLDLPRRIRGTGFGMSAAEEVSALDAANDVVGHAYRNQLLGPADIERIRFPEVRPDPADDARRLEVAAEALGGTLPVRLAGETGFFALWDRLAEWMSPEGILYDLADRPEFLHAIMERYTAANLAYIDRMDALGLFEPAQASVHCSHAYCDELPATGFDAARPRAKDSWAFGMAQIFATVSPAMHEEFEVAYVSRLYARFGLVYYGCCEPLHDRIDVVRRIPNLRKISCSPWCDVHAAAEAIGRDYVVSRKPSPAWLATESPDWGAVERELEEAKAACRRTGSPLEFILKDVSTVKYRPQNLWEWEKRAMAVALD